MKHSSQVITGSGRGKQIGYPTLNLTVPKTFPYQPGVYSGWVWIHGQKHLGAFHYGPIPTFDQTQPSLEVFLIDCQLDQSPSKVSFQFHHRLRPVKKFSDSRHLSAQIQTDIARIKQLNN